MPLVEQVESVSGQATKLSVERLSVCFKRDGKDLSVLDSVSLDIAQGEFLCILGPSGCGKSTLLHVMAGFLAADGGSVLIDGEAVQWT